MYFPHVYVALTHVAILCLYILCLDDELCMLKSQINFCFCSFCFCYALTPIWDTLKLAPDSQKYRTRKWEFNVPTALYISTLQMHVFSTKILFKFIQFYKFASENSSNNLNDYF